MTLQICVAQLLLSLLASRIIRKQPDQKQNYLLLWPNIGASLG